MEKVHCMSLSSIHIHYNHSPVQALSSLAGHCTPLLMFNCPEVVRCCEAWVGRTCQKGCRSWRMPKPKDCRPPGCSRSSRWPLAAVGCRSESTLETEVTSVYTILPWWGAHTNHERGQWTAHSRDARTLHDRPTRKTDDNTQIQDSSLPSLAPRFTHSSIFGLFTSRRPRRGVVAPEETSSPPKGRRCFRRDRPCSRWTFLVVKGVALFGESGGLETSV